LCFTASFPSRRSSDLAGSLPPSTEVVSKVSPLRLLVLSEIDDWDLGPQLKACGHEIVAWVRPTWGRDPKCGGLCQVVRTTVKARSEEHTSELQSTDAR